MGGHVVEQARLQRLGHRTERRISPSTMDSVSSPSRSYFLNSVMRVTPPIAPRMPCTTFNPVTFPVCERRNARRHCVFVPGTATHTTVNGVCVGSTTAALPLPLVAQLTSAGAMATNTIPYQACFSDIPGPSSILWVRTGGRTGGNRMPADPAIGVLRERIDLQAARPRIGIQNGLIVLARLRYEGGCLHAGRAMSNGAVADHAIARRRRRAWRSRRRRAGREGKHDRLFGANVDLQWPFRRIRQTRHLQIPVRRQRSECGAAESWDVAAIAGGAGINDSAIDRTQQAQAVACAVGGFVVREQLWTVLHDRA